MTAPSHPGPAQLPARSLASSSTPGSSPQAPWHLHIDHLVWPAGLALPPGGVGGLQAALAEALQQAMQGPQAGALSDGHTASHACVRQIAQALLPRVQAQLAGTGGVQSEAQP